MHRQRDYYFVISRMLRFDFYPALVRLAIALDRYLVIWCVNHYYDMFHFGSTAWYHRYQMSLFSISYLLRICQFSYYYFKIYSIN